MGCVLFISNVAAAQTRVNSWTTEDGLPQNSVRAIVQATDGYLWLGTFEGLVRFDGVNFTVFNNINTPQMRSNFVRALLEDRAGNLWIGIDGGGLLRMTGGGFKRYSKAAGLPSENVMALLEGRDGTLWIGTDDGGLAVFRDGRLTTYGPREGLPDEHVWALAEDERGNLWLGTNRGLVRFKDGRFKLFTPEDGLSGRRVNALAWSRTDGLWVGTSGGLDLWKNGRSADFAEKTELSSKSINNLLLDRGGHLWIGTENNGLYRRTKDDLTADSDFAAPPNTNIQSLYQSSDGTIWVGTNLGGLNQLREGRFRTLSMADGLPEEIVRSVYQDSNGNLWFSTQSRLNRLKDGKITVYADRETGVGGGGALAEDADGNLWVGKLGLAMFRDGRFVSRTKEAGVAGLYIYTLLADRAGNLWIGTTEGLFRFRDGRSTRFTTKDGLVNEYVISTYEDAGGAIWFGTRHGLSRLENGRFTNWTIEDGLTSDHILAFYEDGDGALWIGTSGGGLNRLKDGKFTAVTSRDGLYDNLTFRILEDGRGSLWMCGNRGVYRASLAELNEFADGRRTSVNSYSYGTEDGMLNRECNGASPAGWRTGDGKIWFPTVKGLVSIDPQPINTQPPQVLIEQVRLDGRTLPDLDRIEIDPGRENLEIKYTGISWARPHRIRFRYKLEGLDQNWVEAGTRRTAYYSHLPPGEYTFRVIADNGDGVWNLEGRSLAVKALPAFYQTGWFLALAVLLVGGAVLAVFRARINTHKRRHARQEEFSRRLIEAHESERRRIAAELHDGLGQTLAMIKNRAVFATQNTADLADAKEELDQITEQSAAAINEVREISYNLRPHLLSKLGLTKSLRSLLGKTADSSRIKFNAEIDNIDELFSEEDEMSIYRIVQENLNNILKHAEARKVDISIRKNKGAVIIRISDDGRGFAANGASNKTSGFGLFGIAERVKILGGTHRIRSAPGEGTDVFIKLNKPEKKNGYEKRNKDNNG